MYRVTTHLFMSFTTPPPVKWIIFLDATARRSYRAPSFQDAEPWASASNRTTWFGCCSVKSALLPAQRVHREELGRVKSRAPKGSSSPKDRGAQTQSPTWRGGRKRSFSGARCARQRAKGNPLRECGWDSSMRSTMVYYSVVGGARAINDNYYDINYQPLEGGRKGVGGGQGWGVLQRGYHCQCWQVTEASLDPPVRIQYVCLHALKPMQALGGVNPRVCEILQG